MIRVPSLLKQSRIPVTLPNFPSCLYLIRLPEEAYEMVKDAFELSEKYGTPVLLRPTTRVCHGAASIEISDTKAANKPKGLSKIPNGSYSPGCHTKTT